MSDRLVAFFRSQYPTIHTPLMPATNLRTLYRLGDDSWALLADKISGEAWMIHLHSRLQPSQMYRAATLAQLTTLVIDSIASSARTMAFRSTLRVPLVRPAFSAIALPPKPIRRLSTRSKRIR
ncbi:hypothetical protein B5K05_33430 [Rhizobium phaseoli]|uniref:hypothetical protein n=1 Tax=Rhizobium phaseoli TaxID=396 RepID=UPI000E0DC142|nr:hypothetical protein [Rhizobium phaseoli]RDJ00775.1 hypothetical protein B5K05_33430 [Rhizobium phaseoli]RDJ00974.1 hypothetical protein B5K04_31510 [Rhizobium phaseoli]